MINRAELWAIVEQLETTGPIGTSTIINQLQELGAVTGIHVGKPPEEFTEDMGVEWYAGQGLSMLQEEFWAGINSWINCLDKFVPLYPIVRRH